MLLIGIVVTNAIVLITFVEQQRARGLPTREALIQSGRARARPILMTGCGHHLRPHPPLPGP
jgi:HAE1 family hydrophobic/amphiphilic exporter-1